MMITLVLVGLVTVGLFRLFSSTNRTYRRGTENIDGQQNARAALNWLAKELRSAKGFTQIGPNTVTFQSDKTTRNQIRTFRLDTTDVDGDGDTSELLLIRNPADDGTFGVYTDEIAVGVDSLGFVFRDGNGNITNARASVQEVEIFVFATGNQMRDRDAVEHEGTRQVGMSTRVKC
jgi:Tfp pilus assembly protein PilW